VKPEQARLLVIELVAAYPLAPISEATTELYAAALLDLDAEIAAQVVHGIVRTEQWFPTLGLLLGAYRRRLTWFGAERAETHGLPEPERPPIPDKVHAWFREFAARPPVRPVDPPRRRFVLDVSENGPVADDVARLAGMPKPEETK
jgi:hypothetical protein